MKTCSKCGKTMNGGDTDNDEEHGGADTDGLLRVVARVEIAVAGAGGDGRDGDEPIEHDSLEA